MINIPGVATAQQPEAAYEPPLFRTVLDLQPPALPPGTRLSLLTDADFAPYSFVTSSGAPAGLSVELALAACAEAGIECTITARPFASLMPALAAGEGDAVVAGPRLDEQAARAALSTRPYFRIMARFAVAAASPLTAPDAASLANRRIGALRGTLHARWLETYYHRSEIVTYGDWAEAGEALRAGRIDALFGDNLQLIYWLAGDAAGNCCKLLGGAFSDFDYFSRNLVIMTGRNRPELRSAFDYGLDMAQKNGAASRIIKAYLPLSPW